MISFTALLVLLATLFSFGGIELPQSPENRLIIAVKANYDISHFHDSDTTIVAENRQQFINNTIESAQALISQDDHFTISSKDPMNLNVLENDRLSKNFNLEIIQEPEIGSAEINDKSILYTPSGRNKVYTDTLTYRIALSENRDNYSTGIAVIDVQQEEEKPELEDFRVYPNPTNGFINVFLPGKILVEYEIVIIDPSGKEVVHKRNIYSSFPFRFNAENLEKGVYLVKIITEDDSITRKIIVN